MRLTSGKTTVETGFTAGGTLYVRTTMGNVTIMKATRNPLTWLRHLLSTPEEDAQSHLRRIDSLPYEYRYTCSCCGAGFDPGHGVLLNRQDAATTARYACGTCVSANNHIDYLRAEGLSDVEILLAIDRMQWL